MRVPLHFSGEELSPAVKIDKCIISRAAAYVFRNNEVVGVQGRAGFHLGEVNGDEFRQITRSALRRMKL